MANIRGIFRTQTSIYDGAFLQKRSQNSPSQIFDQIRNTPLNMIFKSSNHPFHSKTRFQHESFKRKKLSISFKFSFNFNFIVSLFYIVLFSQNVFLVRIIVCSRKPENVFLVMLRKKVLAYFRILEMEKGGGAA